MPMFQMSFEKKKNPKSNTCIFVGYGEFFQGKGYRIFDTSIHHVSINKNVIFDEDFIFPILASFFIN
jgi:hypothetical protein